MRLENLKQEFPQMPPEIRSMMEREVGKHIHQEQPPRKSLRRLPLLILAATLILGSTAFAGIHLYQLYVEKEGNYGLKTGIAAAKNPGTVRMQFHYIPDGMELDKNGFKMYYPGSSSGITVTQTPADSGTSTKSLTLSDQYVISSEELEIGGHSAVYLQLQRNSSEEIRQKLYAAFPEMGTVLTVYAGSDIQKEELLKVIENIELTTAVEYSNDVSWSERIRDWLAGLFPAKTDSGYQIQTFFTEEEMKNMKKPGEAVVVPSGADTPQKQHDLTNDITAVVTGVQIADGLSLLERPEYIPDRWADITDESGKLLPNRIQYIRRGDGVQTLDEIITEETVAQKLVYTTVAYTNNGPETLKNICYWINLLGIAETEDGYSLFTDRAAFRSDTGCDYTTCTGVPRFEMSYHDVHGGNQHGSNYITELKPQETIIIHAAHVVNADELPYLFVDLNAVTGGDEYLETAAQRYVDIRQ